MSDVDFSKAAAGPLGALDEFARAAQETSDPRALAQRLASIVARRLDLERVIVARSFAANAIEPLASAGVRPDALLGMPADLEQWPVLVRAQELGELVVAEHTVANPVVPGEIAAAYDVRSVLAVPLLAHDRCAGFLVAVRGDRPIEVDACRRATLTTLARFAAVLLERALAYEELLRADQRKSTFISFASHELRTPIATVYGVLSTLHLRGSTLREEQLVALRATGYAQAERLRRLTDQLLDLSRLDEKAIRVEPDLLPVRRKIEEIVLLVAERAATEIGIDIAPDLEAALDAKVLDRIVSNLLGNALRYGGPPVRIEAEQRDRHFRLAVEDHGPGVPPELEPVLFERFTRGEGPDRPDGAGLGLSIATAYAHAHGGQIFYQPVQPHGARFEVVIPTANGG